MPLPLRSGTWMFGRACLVPLTDGASDVTALGFARRQAPTIPRPFEGLAGAVDPALPFRSGTWTFGHAFLVPLTNGASDVTALGFARRRRQLDKSLASSKAFADASAAAEVADNAQASTTTSGGVRRGGTHGMGRAPSRTSRRAAENARRADAPRTSARPSARRQAQAAGTSRIAPSRTSSRASDRSDGRRRRPGRAAQDGVVATHLRLHQEEEEDEEDEDEGEDAEVVVDDEDDVDEDKAAHDAYDDDQDATMLTFDGFGESAADEEMQEAWVVARAESSAPLFRCASPASETMFMPGDGFSPSRMLSMGGSFFMSTPSGSPSLQPSQPSLEPSQYIDEPSSQYIDEPSSQLSEPTECQLSFPTHSQLREEWALSPVLFDEPATPSHAAAPSHAVAEPLPTTAALLTSDELAALVPLAVSHSSSSASSNDPSTVSAATAPPAHSPLTRASSSLEAASFSLTVRPAASLAARAMPMDKGGGLRGGLGLREGVLAAREGGSRFVSSRLVGEASRRLESDAVDAVARSLWDNAHTEHASPVATERAESNASALGVLPNPDPNPNSSRSMNRADGDASTGVGLSSLFLPPPCDHSWWTKDLTGFEALLGCELTAELQKPPAPLSHLFG